jgi:hypothetical protein
MALLVTGIRPDVTADGRAIYEERRRASAPSEEND